MHDSSLLERLRGPVGISNGPYQAVDELFKVRELVKKVKLQSLEEAVCRQSPILELKLVLKVTHRRGILLTLLHFSQVWLSLSLLFQLERLPGICPLL